MKTIPTLLILCAGFALAQVAPPRDPKYVGPQPTVEQWKEHQAKLEATPLSTDELAKVRALLATAFPPPLEGMMLPERLRAAKVNVFMSSTCPHCAKEVPHFKALEDAGVTVNANFYSGDQQAAMFLTGLGWEHKPNFVSAEDLKVLPIRGTPTTLVASADGKILKAFVGELTEVQQKELLALAKAK